MSAGKAVKRTLEGGLGSAHLRWDGGPFRVERVGDLGGSVDCYFSR